MKENLKDRLKKVRTDMILSSLFCIVFGLVLLICPGETLDALARVAAIVILVLGICLMISFFLSWVTSVFSMAAGLVFVVAGIWILIDTDILVKLIPIMLGIILMLHGFQAMKMAIGARRYHSQWKLALLLAILSVLFGVTCIVCARWLMEKVLWLIGIILLYDGASNIWITFSSNSAERKSERTDGRANRGNEMIEAKFKDDDH